MSKRESFGEEQKFFENQESIAEDYFSLLGSYDRMSKRIAAVQRRYPVPGDPEITAEISELDKERHKTHLQLLEMGAKLGKEKSDVLVDVIRKQRTLEEYGLPEFSILTENDIIKTDDWHNPYHFNVDSGARLPSSGDEIGWLRERLRERGDKREFSKDKFMLVFAIIPIENYGDDELEPDDYVVRVKRAKALAEQMGGEIFEKRDTSYHEAEAKILGIVFPKKDLEEIAGIIRNNPEKFRLGKEF